MILPTHPLVWLWLYAAAESERFYDIYELAGTSAAYWQGASFGAEHVGSWVAYAAALEGLYR